MEDLYFRRESPLETKQHLRSKVFGSLQDFVEFIKDGVSSYARSTRPGEYSRIDLYKEDAGYESMDAAIQYSRLDYEWQTAGLEYDSAVRAGGGGLYVWTFKGIEPSVRKGQRYGPLAT